MCARIATINLFQTDLDKSWNYLWYWHVRESVPPLPPFSKARGQCPRNAPPFRRPCVHQIHRNTVYASNRRYSIHTNKNSSIGLKNFFTVWCCTNRRSSTCTTNLWHANATMFSSVAKNFVREVPVNDVVSYWRRFESDCFFCLFSNSCKLIQSTSKDLGKFVSGRDMASCWLRHWPCWLWCVPPGIRLLNKLVFFKGKC